MSRGAIYELFSTEYGWTLTYCKSLTFMQIHLQLCKLMERQKREVDATKRGADSKSPRDAPLINDRDQLKSLLGRR